MNWALGDYVMESVIRAGGRSTVYVARKRAGQAGAANGADEADTLRALKVVSIGTDPDARTIADAERRGAELQQAFARHHGLVPWVEAIGEARSCLYVAMELVPGEDLLDMLGRGALPPERALDIAIQLATFLEKTHWFAVPGRAPERIIHADLKPGNVRVRPDGHVCVLDFGIAKAMAERRLETTQKWGTRQYMSPEWLQTGTIDEQVDYWSLGVLLYEMLAGYRPFRRFERHDNQLEDAIRRRERPEALPSRIAPSLQSVVGRLLAPDLAQRYASAADVRVALQACRPHGTPVRAPRPASAGAALLTPASASSASVSSSLPESPASIESALALAATPPVPPLPVPPLLVPPLAGATPAVPGPPGSDLDVATEPATRTPRPDVPTEPVPPVPPLAPHIVSVDADVPTLRAPWSRQSDTIVDSPPTERRPASQVDDSSAAFAPGARGVPGAGGVAAPSAMPGAIPAAIRRSGIFAKLLPRGTRWPQGRRLLVAGLWIVFAIIMATEGIACIAAERLRSDVAVADERELEAALTRRTQLAGWTFFDCALRFRADPVIKDRLVSLADVVVNDYRQEQPTVGRTEWEQARGWLTQAVGLYPADTRLRARLRYTEGHLQRLVGGRRGDGNQARAARQSYYAAIQKFREAATLDSGWADPYLGLAHTYVYGLGDVENAVDALKGAEQRGYRETRRERAQIGDAYRARGERIWRSARDLEGDQQRDAYDRAQKDFKRCVEYFTPIVEFANAADQLRRCEARLGEIEPHRTPWWRRIFEFDSDLEILPPGTPRPNQLGPVQPSQASPRPPASSETPDATSAPGSNASPSPGSKDLPATKEPRTSVPVTPR